MRNIIFGETKAKVPTSNQVMIQWRCKDRHKHCEAKTWQNYFAKQFAEAKEFVAWCNRHSRFFEYRIAPQSSPCSG